jgi:membrane protein implicated in regulation of membrane protease activity
MELSIDFNPELLILIIWFSIIIIGAVIEALTMELTSIWFSLAALVSFLLGIFSVNFVVQIIVFIVLSILMLLSVRPLATNYFRTNVVSTNSDRLIGKNALCVKTIEKEGRGEVKVGGQIWTAIASGQEEIKENDRVEILAIEGVKLIVKKA